MMILKPKAKCFTRLINQKVRTNRKRFITLIIIIGKEKKLSEIKQFILDNNIQSSLCV